MNQDSPDIGAVPVLVVPDDLSDRTLPGLRLMGMSAFRDSLIRMPGEDGAPVLVLADVPVLGFALGAGLAKEVEDDEPLARLIAAAQLPVEKLAEAGDLADRALSLLSRKLAATTTTAQRERGAAATLRRQHMQMQRDFQDLEEWVYDAFAPKYKLVRSWPASESAIALTPGQTVHQPLPVPARGMIWLDLHISESAPAGLLIVQVTRPAGGPFADPVEVPVAPGQSGWIRAALPTAPGGPPEDAVAAIAFRPHDAQDPISLSLAPETSFADFHTDAGPPAPLAIRVYRTIPRLSPPPVLDPRMAVPSDGVTRVVLPRDLGDPKLLPYAVNLPKPLRRYPDRIIAKRWREEDAFFLQPSAARPIVARVTGLSVDSLAQLRAFVHVARHESMEIAFAIGAAPQGDVKSVRQALKHLGDWVHVLPGDWGECWMDPQADMAGPVDLLLAAAMPGQPFNRNATALFRGFRVTGKG